jgi:hypothetical protein
MDDVQHFQYEISQDSNQLFATHFSLSSLLFATDGHLKRSETLPTVQQVYSFNVSLRKFVE